jgi:hypothetical protein
MGELGSSPGKPASKTVYPAQPALLYLWVPLSGFVKKRLTGRKGKFKRRRKDGCFIQSLGSEED